jgi:hypothetical protein
MNKKIVTTLVLGLAALGSSNAFAGYKRTDTIYVASYIATGSVGSVRNSADTSQYISCTEYAWPGSPPSLYCSAYNGSSYASCSSSDPTLLAAALSVGVNSFIEFAWDANGKCNFLQVSNGSLYEPAVR